MQVTLNTHTLHNFGSYSFKIKDEEKCRKLEGVATWIMQNIKTESAHTISMLITDLVKEYKYKQLTHVL